MRIEEFLSMRVPHSPAQLRMASAMAHRMVGVVLTIAATLALNEAFLNGSRGLRIAWSGLVTVLGALLILSLLFRHRLRQWPVWPADLAADPQPREHLVMGLLLVLGGLVEFTHAKGMTTALIWHYGWPGVLVLIGGMFALHAPHGSHDAVTQAVRFHRLLGAVLIAAGLLAGSHALWRRLSLAYLWPLALLLAAVLLIAYREPEGSWEPKGSWEQSDSENPMREI